MLTKELTNLLLKEKMTDAIVERSGGDFNTCFTPGHYSVGGNWTNLPNGAYGYGDLLVLGRPQKYGFVVQMYFCHSKEYFLWRCVAYVDITNIGSAGWIKVTGTVVT